MQDLSSYKLRKKDGSASKQIFLDPSLDSSGWTPKALERLIDMAARLPFGESTSVLKGFGYEISSTELERLVNSYAGCCLKQVQNYLKARAKEPLQNQLNVVGRLFILQIDGVRVLGKSISKVCNGIEIKSVVLYQAEYPRERWMFADIVAPKQLKLMLKGLVKEAGVSKQDKLIGVGDGASWVEGCFEELEIEYVTDVYHSASYLEIVMEALGWEEQKRGIHRRNWCKGKISARNWLTRYVPKRKRELMVTKKQRTAYNYLEERLKHMDYPKYKKRDWPIGSGQIEGMNKSVIGKRMKCSGMQWTPKGAANMASLRAQVCASNPIIKFDMLRHRAFPAPQ